MTVPSSLGPSSIMRASLNWPDRYYDMKIDPLITGRANSILSSAAIERLRVGQFRACEGVGVLRYGCLDRRLELRP